MRSSRICAASVRICVDKLCQDIGRQQQVGYYVAFLSFSHGKHAYDVSMLLYDR
jgi:hypothetical protein